MSYWYTTESDPVCRLSDHGFQMLADVMEAVVPLMISCPAILVCGDYLKKLIENKPNPRIEYFDHQITVFFVGDDECQRQKSEQFSISGIVDSVF